MSLPLCHPLTHIEYPCNMCAPLLELLVYSVFLHGLRHRGIKVYLMDKWIYTSLLIYLDAGSGGKSHISWTSSPSKDIAKPRAARYLKSIMLCLICVVWAFREPKFQPPDFWMEIASWRSRSMWEFLMLYSFWFLHILYSCYRHTQGRKNWKQVDLSGAKTSVRTPQQDIDRISRVTVHTEVLPGFRDSSALFTGKQSYISYAYSVKD